MAYQQPNSVHKIARLGRTDSSETRIVLQEYEERTVLDIRKYYKTKKMEKFAPTAKGVTIPLEDLTSLKSALNKALKIAEKEGLLEK